MLPSVVAALLPTPTATPSLDSLATELAVDWGKYEPAIRRHEAWIGRPAPHPTSIGVRGGKTLNPALSEWMMGWPAGWVTDVPALTPNEQKKLCGNGVVPRQIQAAVRHLLPLLAFEERAA